MRAVLRDARRFLERIEAIPEANKAVRIRQLAHASRAFKAKGNYQAMADMLERIAKEVGDVYSNCREVTGKDGGPMRMDYNHLTDEQACGQQHHPSLAAPVGRGGRVRSEPNRAHVALPSGPCWGDCSWRPRGTW